MRVSIFDQRLVEGAVRIAAEPMALQLLAGRQRHHAVDAETVAVAGKDHVGVAAAFEVFADACEQVVGYPRAERLTDVHVLARYLDLHDEMNAPS